MARDVINEEDARNRINAQMSLDLKRSQANIVIDNSGSLEDLEEQFQKVLAQVTRPLTWTEFWLSRQGASRLLCPLLLEYLLEKMFLANYSWKSKLPLLNTAPCILFMKKNIW